MTALEREPIGAHPGATTWHPGPVISSGLLLGAGLGGFFDGILLHQILQWHNMLSSVRPPLDLVAMKYNMFWDGLFHAATWLMTIAGITRLWCAGRSRQLEWSTRLLLGAVCSGWGLFNFAEGLIDHQLLGIHHVHPGNDELAWDLGFLASGLALMATGALLIKSARSRAEARRPTHAE